MAAVAPSWIIITWSRASPSAVLKLPIATMREPSGDAASLATPTGALAGPFGQLWLVATSMPMYSSTAPVVALSAASPPCGTVAIVVNEPATKRRLPTSARSRTVPFGLGFLKAVMSAPVAVSILMTFRTFVVRAFLNAPPR